MFSRSNFRLGLEITSVPILFLDSYYTGEVTSKVTVVAILGSLRAATTIYGM